MGWPQFFICGPALFPPGVRRIRGCIIDYIGRKGASPELVLEVVSEAIRTKQLTKSEVLSIIEKIEEKKTRKLRPLKKMLAGLPDVENVSSTIHIKISTFRI